MKSIVRPWGTIFQIVCRKRFAINIIKIEAFQRLSLQSHQFRDELWILVAQKSVVEVAANKIISGIINFVWIQKNVRHRLKSMRNPVYFLELALGEYSLDDIIRYEDDYNRIV